METDTQVRRAFDYAPGVEINYEVRGIGQQPAVLLHGFGASLGDKEVTDGTYPIFV